MFEISEGDLPVVQTRRALLILDLQNDVVSAGGILQVDQPADFLDKIVTLVPKYRETGSVIWVRTQFESRRAVNDGSATEERVITDKELPLDSSDGQPDGRRKHMPSKSLQKLFDKMSASKEKDDGPLTADQAKKELDKPERPVDNETFLTIEPGQGPRCLLPSSPGSDYNPVIQSSLDLSKDLSFTKSHYSAFKSGTLLQMLRGQFVTELFICGALTNISVFATAMDAARFGYSITLVEDCLGYKSKARHDEAIRQMVDTTGCEITTSSEMIEDIKAKESARSRRSNAPRGGREFQDHRRIRDAINNLKLRNEKTAATANADSAEQPSIEPRAPEASASTSKAEISNESLVPATMISGDSLPERPLLPKRSEGDLKKRVPNKIRSRRRHSRSNNTEPRPAEVHAGSSQSDKTSQNVLSPVQGLQKPVPEILKEVQTETPTGQEKVPTIAMAPALSSTPTTEDPQATSLAVTNGGTVTAESKKSISDAVVGKGKERIEETAYEPVGIVPQENLIKVPEEDAGHEAEDKAEAKTGEKTVDVVEEKVQVENQQKGEEVGASESVIEPNGSTVDSAQLHKVDPLTETQSNSHEDTFSICEGDSTIIHNLLSETEAVKIFERVRDEVRWQRMSHQGGEVPRLVAVEGEIGEDRSIPIYRHPADESPPLFPFSPTVSIIRAEVEKRLGHKVNHCLIQFYRTGTDYISEHSDKTLDIAADSFIANVSLGALRAMTFRTKKPLKNPQALQSRDNVPRLSCKAPLPHNSMCKMGLKTNEKWLHSIRQDKRRAAEKSEAELAFGGGRISLTFRLIGTFLDRDETKIWGQGAVAKDKASARSVINGETPEAEKMLWAFGKENHSSDFSWDESYGAGFDVLHISNARKLFLSGDAVADMRVKLALAEYGLNWTAGQLSPPFKWKDGSDAIASSHSPDTKGPQQQPDGTFPVKFVDNDLSRATIQGDLAILLYLDVCYGPSADAKSAAQKARQFTRLQAADALLLNWRQATAATASSSSSSSSSSPLWSAAASNMMALLLAPWETYAAEDSFMTGPVAGVTDYAVWPVVREIFGTGGGAGEGWEFPYLRAYCERMGRRGVVTGLLGETTMTATTEKKVD